MENPINSPIISYCGLYCNNCYKYKNGKCASCHKYDKASWCKVRTCCIENNRTTCAECSDFSDVKQCRKINNFISNMFGIVFNSDRMAGINFIRTHGPEAFISKLEAEKAMTFKRTKKNRP